MPYHMAPPIRALEEFHESGGTIASVDTAAVAILKAAESGGTKAKLVPKFFARIWRGTVYTAT